MIKTILTIFTIFLPHAVYAACPSGWEEVPLENIELHNNSCPSSTQTYYNMTQECNVGIQ